MFYIGNTYRGMESSSTSEQSASYFGCFDNYTRRDDLLPTTFIGKGTSNSGHASGVEIEEGTKSDDNPICESGLNGSKIALFSELKLV